jgi:hypothetical protein
MRVGRGYLLYHAPNHHRPIPLAPPPPPAR